ncbi:MAG: hypothetical protein ACSI46_16570 [Gloeotrichia echinulata DVL01]
MHRWGHNDRSVHRWGHNDRSVHRWGHNDRSVHRWGLIAKITGFLFFYEYARKIFSETAAGR